MYSVQILHGRQVVASGMVNDRAEAYTKARTALGMLAQRVYGDRAYLYDVAPVPGEGDLVVQHHQTLRHTPIRAHVENLAGLTCRKRVGGSPSRPNAPGWNSRRRFAR